MSTSNKSDDADRLLEEYSITSQRIDQTTAYIWNTALLFVGLLGAAFGLAINVDVSEPLDWYLIGFMSIVTGFSLWWWNAVSDRWNEYISCWHLRLHDIETRLGFHSNLAIKEADERRRAQGNFKSIGIQSMRKLLGVFSDVGWIMYWLLLVMNDTAEKCWASSCSFDIEKFGYMSSTFILLLISPGLKLIAKTRFAFAGNVLQWLIKKF